MVKNTTFTATGSTDIYTSCVETKQEEKTETEQTKETVGEKAAVYEKSSKEDASATYSVNKMSEEDRSALVKKLKEEQVVRQQQLVSIVQKMLNKQSATYTIATGSYNMEEEDGIWKFLASGEYTVDAATKAQAQADIAEDGYYGVKQTSERLFDFASALAGDDVDKMQKMQAAVKKGFEEATAAWGKDLPDICKKTLDATDQLFEDYYASKSATKTEA